MHSLLEDRELERLKQLTVFENAAREKGFKIIAGVDEAGRGPLAGPVVAAACILPEGLLIEGVDDSKKLSPSRRKGICRVICENPNIIYGIGIISSEEIDQINIYQATIKAMLAALENLKEIPDCILADAMQLDYAGAFCQKIIKGDQKSQSIAAASIIAKETRDRLMKDCHEQWPEYGFNSHKGYGTEKHRKALLKYGPCPVHRFSFEPVASIASKNWK